LRQKNVLELVVVSFPPELRLCTGLDELRCDPHVTTAAPNGAFEHILNRKIPSDVCDAVLARFVLQDGRAGDSPSFPGHRIVVNAAMMKLRRRRTRPETSIDDLLPTYAADGTREVQLTDGALLADEEFSKRQPHELVRECVGALPDIYQAVYFLRDVEERSTEETAMLLGVTPNAVKIRLHRARQALMTLVQRRCTAARVAVMS
jgi:DNA-directed RNA polymerase specialized sigma24 family protein